MACAAAIASPRGAGRVLAASGETTAPWWEVGLWVAVLLGAILLLAVFVYVYRSRVRGGDVGAGPEFSLQDLRVLRERGDLTEAEFDHLRANLLADVRDGRRAPDGTDGPSTG
ncbi:MAG: SHOCT domain-containing protein [Phycisphaerales bacterium]|nr:MAG: SHOCT domain-containing protein [Phycisphaerales bacterium]